MPFNWFSLKTPVLPRSLVGGGPYHGGSLDPRSRKWGTVDSPARAAASWLLGHPARTGAGRHTGTVGEGVCI